MITSDVVMMNGGGGGGGAPVTSWAGIGGGGGSVQASPAPGGCGSCGSWGGASPALIPDTRADDLGLSVQVGTGDWLVVVLLVAVGLFLLSRGGK